MPVRYLFILVIAENLTPEQVQAYRIADNKTGEIAEWNYDLLPIELRDLQERYHV